MRWLLEHGADPSLNADGESSPVGVAASRGTSFIISQLLEHGVKLDDSNALLHSLVIPTQPLYFHRSLIKSAAFSATA